MKSEVEVGVGGPRWAGTVKLGSRKEVNPCSVSDTGIPTVPSNPRTVLGGRTRTGGSLEKCTPNCRKEFYTDEVGVNCSSEPSVSPLSRQRRRVPPTCRTRWTCSEETFGPRGHFVRLQRVVSEKSIHSNLRDNKFS